MVVVDGLVATVAHCCAAAVMAGTETRVNAGQAEYGYMCDYTEMVKKVRGLMGAKHPKTDHDTHSARRRRQTPPPFPLVLGAQTGRLENVLGWYHSHPGYGCWLSGIDVGTQRMNQQYQDPWLAIVVRKGGKGAEAQGRAVCTGRGYERRKDQERKAKRRNSPRKLAWRSPTLNRPCLASPPPPNPPGRPGAHLVGRQG